MDAAHRLRLTSRVLTVACATFIAAASLGGCRDESDPATWVKRMAVPAKRSDSIQHLSSLYDATMTKAHGDRDDPQVKAFIDATVDPLVLQYLGGALDTQSRQEAIKVLADSHDPRSGPALVKAFKEYEPSKTDYDLRAAAKGVRETVVDRKVVAPAVVEALWGCFLAFSPSRAGSQDVGRELREALLALKSPDHVQSCPQLITSSPLVPDATDLQFRQRVCIDLIHQERYAPAVIALVSILLTPTQRALATDATRALSVMPRNAEMALATALTGTAPEFASLERPLEQRGYIRLLAEPLSLTGRAQGGDAARAALNAADNDQNRVAVVRTLYRYPADSRTTTTFMAVYKKIPAGQNEPEVGGNPHIPFILQAPGLYDIHLTEWLLKQVAAAKGDEKDAIALIGLQSAIELMAPHQAPAVAAAVAKDGTAVEKDMFTAASEVAKKCATDAACYVAVLDEPVHSNGSSVAAIKGATMAAIYGSDATREELVERLDKIKDGAVLEAVVHAILRLSPAGDIKASKALDGLVPAGPGVTPELRDEISKVAQILRARVR